MKSSTHTQKLSESSQYFSSWRFQYDPFTQWTTIIIILKCLNFKKKNIEEKKFNFEWNKTTNMKFTVDLLIAIHPTRLRQLEYLDAQPRPINNNNILQK